jgi:alcohol dehydrogenase class IV
MSFYRTVEMYVPVKVVSGIGSTKVLAEKVKELGKSRPLIITDKGVVKAGKLEIVRKHLKSAGIDCIVFDEALPDPPISNVDEAVEQARSEKVDLIIGLGGGSALDVAKAVRVVSPNEGKVSDWIGLHLDYPKRPLDLISIPTTAGTGSEVSSASVVTDEKKEMKVVLKSPRIFSTIAILDSEMLSGMPPRIAAETGFDAITHAVENFVSRNRNFMTQALALRAITILFKNLRRFVCNTNDLETGMEMLNGCALAGIAMTTGGLGLAHAIGHPVGTHCKISHGLACGISLPHVVQYNIPADTKSFAEIALAINPHHAADYLGPASLADRVLLEIESLMEDIEIPKTLKEAGKNLEITEAIIQESSTSFLAQLNPRTVSRDKVIDILNKIK